MRKPTPPGTPPQEEPEGGRALGRTRQFARSRGLPAPDVEPPKKTPAPPKPPAKKRPKPR